MSGYSFSSDDQRSVHLDAFHKHVLGWMDARVHSLGTPQEVTIPVTNAARLDAPVLLWDPGRGPGNYFLLEYRTPSPPQGLAYDEAVAGSGPGVVREGLAVWRVPGIPSNGRATEHLGSSDLRPAGRTMEPWTIARADLARWQGYRYPYSGGVHGPSARHDPGGLVERSVSTVHLRGAPRWPACLVPARWCAGGRRARKLGRRDGGRGWRVAHVFAAGNGVIYAITMAESSLVSPRRVSRRRRPGDVGAAEYRLSRGRPRLEWCAARILGRQRSHLCSHARRRTALVQAQRLSQRRRPGNLARRATVLLGMAGETSCIFSAGDGIIYAIAPSGELRRTVS